MRPQESTIQALALGTQMSLLAYKAYGDEYTEIRAEMTEEIRAIGLEDVELPQSYEEFQAQYDEMFRLIGAQLARNRSTLGGDVLGLPMFYLGYFPLRCIMRLLLKLDWEMERTLLEAALDELDLDADHMRMLEKEAGWVQVFTEPDDVELSSNDLRMASVRFTQYAVEQWAKNHPDSRTDIAEATPTSASPRDTVISAVVSALRERNVFDAVERRVREMSEPGDPELDRRDHIGFAEQWLRWYGSAPPRDRVEARLWKAFDEVSAGDAGVSIGRAVVTARLRSVLADPSKTQHLILLVHGIRTEAQWQEMVASILAQNPDTKAFPIRYGFFDALRFWLPFTRERAIKHLRQKIVAAYKSAHASDAYVQISIVAHSFGTYAVGRILQTDRDLHLHRLVLCGTILPRDFDWELVRDQITGGVLNDCGSRDVWPVLAQSMSWGYGASGVFGFGHPRVCDRFHDFGHSGCFQRDFVTKYWSSFLLEGRVERSDWELDRPPAPYWMSTTSILPLRWLGPLVVVAVVWLIFALAIR